MSLFAVSAAVAAPSAPPEAKHGHLFVLLTFAIAHINTIYRSNSSTCSLLQRSPRDAPPRGVRWAGRTGPAAGAAAAAGRPPTLGDRHGGTVTHLCGGCGPPSCLGCPWSGGWRGRPPVGGGERACGTGAAGWWVGGRARQQWSSAFPACGGRENEVRAPSPRGAGEAPPPGGGRGQPGSRPVPVPRGSGGAPPAQRAGGQSLPVRLPPPHGWQKAER